MRQLASLLLLVLAFPVSAADIWRWKDANGVYHYSDQPVAGAVKMNMGLSAPPASPPAPVAPPNTAGPVLQPTTVPYASCVVLAPAADEVFNNVNSVNASLQITPSLQTGHRVQVLLNGRVYPGWPDQALSSTLADLFRGSYSVSVQVLDAGGRTVCAGPATTFHVRQPSILSPARQPAARP
jgi:hypothetical protein